MLHHGNAVAWASLLSCNYLAKHETTVVSHPTYSPDLDPADFVLFSKLKTTLKRCFQTININEIEENATQQLCTMSKNAFQKMKKHCEQCFACSGDYFEGDKTE